MLEPSFDHPRHADRQAASAYIPELAPPAHRGFFAGLNGVMIGLGVALASYVGMGFYFCDNKVASWRAPMGMPLIIPIVLLCAIPFLPESPRYLLLKDRPEEARRIFNKLNTSRSADASLFDEEFNQMQQQAAYDRVLDSSWKGLFTRPTYRKRVFLSCVICSLNQCTGVLVINNYGQTFYKALGFSPATCQILQGNRDISKSCLAIVYLPWSLNNSRLLFVSADMRSTSRICG